MNNYSQTRFLTSSAEIKQLPADHGVEIAFAGRSNVGKSSVLNTLTQQKTLAKTSKTPGRTRLINLFQVQENLRLVDLPGYGYAKVPQAMKEHWQQVLSEYLQTRKCLRGLVLVMDIRHPLTEYDEAMLEWAVGSQLPVHILLNKADKLTYSELLKTTREVEAIIKTLPLCTVQIFSAHKKQGLGQLVQHIDNWVKENKHYRG